jgi:hypothetical protein
MNHIASKEGTIFGRRGARNFAYHESYCDERVVMTIYGFQFFDERVVMTIYGFQIFLVTSVPGGEVMPLYSIWAGSTFLLKITHMTHCQR